MISYPPSWLCKNCKRPFKLHVKIGDPNEEGSEATLPANFNWCFSKRALKYNSGSASFKFIPVDNLTLIELLAKKKGV